MKCGIFVITIATQLVILFLFLEIFILFMSPNIHWYYAFVAAVLLVPLIIASVFLFGFFCKDDEKSRGKLDVACYMAIISFVLLSAWNLAYFIALYKPDQIQIQSQNMTFWQTSKKQFLVWNLFIVSILVFLYGYFICVTRRYWYRLKDKSKKEEEQPKEEDDKEKKAN